MICRQCGRNLPDNAKFCIGCGLPTQQAPTPTPPPPVYSPQPDYAVPAVPPAAQPPVEAYQPAPPAVPAVPQDVPTESENFGFRQPEREAFSAGESAQPAQPSYGAEQPGYNSQQYAWMQNGGGYPPAQGADTWSGEPEPENYVKSRKPGLRGKGVPVGLRILSIFLSVLLILSGVAASALLALRWSYNPEQIKTMVSSVDLTSIEIPMEDGSKMALVPFLENQAGIRLEQDCGITRLEADRVLAQPFIKNFISEVVSDYTGYLLFGEELRPLTRDRVVDFFRTNDREIYSLTGFSFREHERDWGNEGERYLEHYDLDELFDNSLKTSAISADYLQRETGVDLEQIRSFLSTGILVATLALTALMIILIVLCLLRSLRSALLTVGISLSVLGVLDLLGGLGGRLWLNTQKIDLLDLIKVFVDPFFSKLAIIGAVLLVLGVLLIVVRILIRRPAREEI